MALSLTGVETRLTALADPRNVESLLLFDKFESGVSGLLSPPSLLHLCP